MSPLPLGSTSLMSSLTSSMLGLRPRDFMAMRNSSASMPPGHEAVSVCVLSREVRVGTNRCYRGPVHRGHVSTRLMFVPRNQGLCNAIAVARGRVGGSWTYPYGKDCLVVLDLLLGKVVARLHEDDGLEAVNLVDIGNTAAALSEAGGAKGGASSDAPFLIW